MLVAADGAFVVRIVHIVLLALLAFVGCCVRVSTRPVLVFTADVDWLNTSKSERVRRAKAEAEANAKDPYDA